MTLDTVHERRTQDWRAAAAVAAVSNLVLWAVLYFTTDDTWFAVTGSVLGATVLVGLGLVARPGSRRVGYGVVAGAAIAAAVVFLALSAVGMAVGS